MISLLWLTLLAADPAGFVIWNAADLKKTTSDGARFSSQSLGRFKGHYAMLAHRQGNGGAELHETETDIFVIETGSAKLIVGGQIIHPKTTGPHEIRGSSIEGGLEKTLEAGDIVHIPAKTPHQLLVGSAAKFTYFVLKVQAQ